MLEEQECATTIQRNAFGKSRLTTGSTLALKSEGQAAQQSAERDKPLWEADEISTLGVNFLQSLCDVL